MARNYFRILAASAVLLGAAAPSQSLAAVVGYSWFVQGDSSVIAQYDFVGDSDAERRNDKSPSANHLVEKKVGSPAISTAYGAPGFDSSSTAVFPGYNSTSNAWGFFTSQQIALPNPVSFEAIISPGGTSNGYMAGIYNGTLNRRAYFVAQTSETALNAIAGTSWNNRAALASPFALDDWYYFAVTMSHDADANQTTIDTWRANLTLGETSLTKVAQSTVPGSYLITDYLGIGLLNAGGNPSEAWKGVIDEVTLYSGLKDTAFFQANLDRILDPHFVPEPSTSLMAIMAMLGWLTCSARRGRKRGER
ncbi:MAG: hypothetical protein U1E05_04930 [Patescibacteria group bacterium]|nr:hypothetical protein [Patescibacteria group bacterium]